MPSLSLITPWVLIVLAHVAVPAVFCYGVARARVRSRLSWVVRAAGAVAYVAFAFIAGRWDWVGVWVRFVWPALLVVALVLGWRRVRARGWFARADRWTVIGDFAAFVGFTVMLAVVLNGLVQRGEAVELAVPIRAERLYVAQGGASLLLNHHRSVKAQQSALDLVSLDAWGLRASLLAAADLEDYQVFGAEVVSPCAGVVIEAVDGMPDQVPPARDSKKPEGNHVILRCSGVRVLLAHLQKGTVRVRPGEHVDVGATVGRVGNSGNSTEPHLHLQATRDGIGVPMRVEGRVLARNAVLRGRAE